MSVRQRKNDDKAVDSVPVPSHINDTNGSTLDSTTAASLSIDQDKNYSDFTSELNRVDKALTLLEDSEHELDPTMPHFIANIAWKAEKLSEKASKKLAIRIRDRTKEIVVRAKRIIEKHQTAKNQKRLHKLCYVTVFFYLVIASYWLGCSPRTFYLLYAAGTVLFVFMRWAYYRSLRWHYFLLDFCYWANAIMITYALFMPRSKVLWDVVVGFAGTLGISTYVFRNSLVPHSVDMMTSAQIHFFPQLLVWTIRWFGGAPTAAELAIIPSWTSQPSDFDFSIPLHRGKNIPFEEALRSYFYFGISSGDRKGEISDVAELFGFEFGTFWIAILCYLLWAFLYYTKIFFVSKDKIEAKQYYTLFVYIMEDHLSKLPKKLEKHREVAFGLAHFCLYFFSSLTVPLFYANFTLHCCWILGLFGILVHNGASFYIEYFARHYQGSLEVLERAAAERKHQKDEEASHSTAALDAAGGEIYENFS